MFEAPAGGSSHINDADLKTPGKGKPGKTGKAKGKGAPPAGDKPAGKRGDGVAARRDSAGNEAAIEISVLKKRAKELEALYKKKQDAAEAYNIGRKAVAEASGLMSSVVDKLVKARVDKKFADKQREYEQLTLVFAEIGE